MLNSIIESKNYIPQVMRRSRDMQAICKVLDLLINNFKTNVDYWTSLIDFDTCPDHLLPLLASYVGYKYDYTESYSTNRLIIKHYPEMIRLRGSELGISLATALSVEQDNSPEVAAMIGASVALSISDIPFGGPTAAVNVGLVDGQIIINPTAAEREKSDLTLTVAGTKAVDISVAFGLVRKSVVGAARVNDR